MTCDVTQGSVLFCFEYVSYAINLKLYVHLILFPKDIWPRLTESSKSSTDYSYNNDRFLILIIHMNSFFQNLY